MTKKDNQPKGLGRPRGSKYGEKDYYGVRLSVPCKKWIQAQGGSSFLESLVPKNYRAKYKNK